MSNLTELEKDPGIGYNLQPDYINVHAYATSFGGLKGKVEQFHNAFSSLPVYITEFAMHVSPSHNTVKCHPDQV